jgi:pantoate--beta-alanine ligase
MVICRTVKSMGEYALSKAPGTLTGFIPTMGALHEGHLSLIGESLSRGRFTVCSIFVNPTQFNDPSDYAKYPKTLDKDILLLESSGADVLFLPSVEEVYPDGLLPARKYDLGYLETILEGKYRPGHFQGVCQVVERLLRIVRPDELFMGQKDYQQCMVLKKLIELEHLPVTMIIGPTRREADGLAMSSRNLRLDDAQRKSAVELFRTLQWVKSGFRPGPLEPIKREGTAQLEAKGFRVDYVEIADARDLTLLETWDGVRPAVALVAAYSGEVRLIDNELL